MAISEESRHHLYQRLEEVLGREETKVLMEYLPPVGWADVVTKRDLDALETRMDMRFARIDERFTDMDHRLARIEQMPREFRSLLYALMSFMAVMVGAMVAAIRI